MTKAAVAHPFVILQKLHNKIWAIINSPQPPATKTTGVLRDTWETERQSAAWVIPPNVTSQ